MVGGHEVASRGKPWRDRWRHLGNYPKSLVADARSDLAWFRTSEERDYFNNAISFVDSVLTGARTIDSPEQVLVLSFYPRVSDLEMFNNASQWVRDFETEHRIRTRNRSNSIRIRRKEKSIFMGWHNFEFFHASIESRNIMYAVADDKFFADYEVDRVLLVPSPWCTIYFAKHLVDYDMSTTRTRDWREEGPSKIRNSLRYMIPAEYSFLAFVRFVHNALYGCYFRGFLDPAIRANHGRFTGVISPLPTRIHEYIDKLDIQALLLGTGIPFDKARMALDRSRSIDWVSYTTKEVAGRYFRYDPITGEVDNLPACRAGHRDKRTGEIVYRQLPAQEVKFANVVQYVSQLCTSEKYRQANGVIRNGEYEEHFSIRLRSN